MTHGHGHGHSHGHHGEISEKRLILSTLLNLVITLAEFIGGLLSNSLSLLSDALHNLSDTIAMFIALVANKASKKTANTQMTFGYKRIEILAAFFNAVVLVAISIYLFVEAIQRFYHPEEIKGGIMLIVAAIGLVANLVSMLLLKNDSAKSLNIKAAYLHLLGDTLSSVAVIVGGVLIYYKGYYWIDPLVTIVVGLYILKESWSIITETIEILMQSTPTGIDLEEVKSMLEQMPEIENIHHIHAWKMNENISHFEGHINLKKDIFVSKTEEIKRNVEHVLHEQFNFKHVTLQFEYKCCTDKIIITH